MMQLFISDKEDRKRQTPQKRTDFLFASIYPRE